MRRLLTLILLAFCVSVSHAQVPDSTTAAADYVVGSDITNLPRYVITPSPPGDPWHHPTSEARNCQWQETEWYVQRDTLVGTEAYYVSDCLSVDAVGYDTCASLTVDWQPVYMTIKSHLLEDTCTGELRLPKRKEN